MKHWKTAAAAAGLLCVLSVPAWADATTSIYFNGKLLPTTQPVVNQEGRTLVAFRDLFEGLGAEVNWDEEFRMATVTYGKNKVNLFPDNGAAQVNGEAKALDVGPQMVNDRIYLPLRFVAESLGSTVDYTKDEVTDHGTIQINTVDSVQNYAIKEGNVLSILRTTKAPQNTLAADKNSQTAYEQWQNANSGYFMDDNGNLVEIFTHDNQVTVNVMDLSKAKVNTNTYTTDTVFPAIDSIERKGNDFVIQFKQETNHRYVGVGEPLDGTYFKTFETRQGEYLLYNGRADKSEMRINAKTDESSGVIAATDYGYTLGIANRSTDARELDYAISNKGSYAFLTDGHLFIMDDNIDEKYDEMLTTKISSPQIFVYEDRFVVLGIENELRYPELYAGVYDSEGNQIYYFDNISNLSKKSDQNAFYEYNYLRLVDSAQDGYKIYALLQNGWDRYLVIYNILDNTSITEKFSIKEKAYSSFIYTAEGVKLLAMDNDYYYVRDCD